MGMKKLNKALVFISLSLFLSSCEQGNTSSLSSIRPWSYSASSDSVYLSLPSSESSSTNSSTNSTSQVVSSSISSEEQPSSSETEISSSPLSSTAVSSSVSSDTVSSSSNSEVSSSVSSDTVSSSSNSEVSSSVSSDTVSSSSQEQISSSSSSSSIVSSVDQSVFTLDQVKAIYQDKVHPSKIKYSMVYKAPSANITLNETSTLIVEYSSPYKAMYTYSKENLNQAGSSSLISTTEDTVYFTGNTVNGLINNNESWVSKVEPYISLKKLAFDSNYISAFSSSNYTIDLSLNDANINDFFNIETNLKKVSMKIFIDDESIEPVKLSLSALTSSEAEVTMSFLFMYEPQTVTIP